VIENIKEKTKNGQPRKRNVKLGNRVETKKVFEVVPLLALSADYSENPKRRLFSASRHQLEPYTHL